MRAGRPSAQHSALRYLRYEACPAGHELFHSGQAGDKFYVIVRGEVKIMEVSATKRNASHGFPCCACPSHDRCTWSLRLSAPTIGA